MDVINTSALARYFAGRVEKARDALSAVHLPHYADEVCIMLPKSPEEFFRFVRWCEGMASCLARWTNLPHIRASVDGEQLADARQAVESLARDARELLTIYERRKAHVAKTGLAAEGSEARRTSGLCGATISERRR